MRKLCFSVIRTLIIIVNIIILALAAVLAKVSIVAYYQNYLLNYSDTYDVILVHLYISLICCGLSLLIGLMALLGIIGAARNSKSILTTYATILFLIFNALILTIIATYATNPANYSTREVDKSFVNSTVVIYNYVDSGDIKTRIIDNIQRSFSCCGVNSPNDWTEYSLHRIPRSCCSEPVESSLPVFKYCTESDYKHGCWKVLLEHLQSNLPTVRMILYMLIAFSLIFIWAASFIVLTLRKNFDVV